MINIGIDGYNSYLAKNFIKKYKKKIKIFKYDKDINDIKKITEFINKKKIKIFIRVAGLSRSTCEKNLILCNKTNYLANKKLIDLILIKKIKLIFLSTSQVYRQSKKKINEKSFLFPQNKYAVNKLKTEIYIQKKLKNYLIIRSFNIYGKNQPLGYFIPDIKYKISNNKKIIINNSFRDFIKIDEVSRFIKFCIDRNILGIFNIGSGKSISLRKIVLYLGRKSKRKINLIVNNKKDKIVNDISSLTKIGFKVKNEKNFNF